MVNEFDEHILVCVGGLVQRTTGSSGPGATGGGATPYDPPGAEGGIDQPEDEDDTGDSKAMRMTLMEEVLLLGLKDREVNETTKHGHLPFTRYKLEPDTKRTT